MPTIEERAERAIRDYLQRFRQGELELNWRRRNPKDHWGLPESTWRDRASRIIGRFNELDATGPQINRRLKAVRNALRYFHDKPAGQFEQYMIDKASGAPTAPGIEASPAGGAK